MRKIKYQRKMDFLPISVRISERKILLVGGGHVATHKAEILSHFTDNPAGEKNDNVTIIAPSVSPEIKSLPFRVEEREFKAEDLEGVSLLFVCTGDKELNHRIKALAQERGILCSVCDDPAYCEFISPAISRTEGDGLTIAVASDGKDVKRSIRVRNRINALIISGLLHLD